MASCPCRCHRTDLSQTQIWHHIKAKAKEEEDRAQAEAQAQAQAPIMRESLPPPKCRRISHFQAGASSSSSGDPKFHAPSFEHNILSPLPNSPMASDSLQLPEDAPTKVSGCFVNDVLLRLHARTHRTTNDNDNEDSDDASGGTDNGDSDDALDGDEVEAADSIDPETNNFRDGENVDMEGGVDSCEGIVLGWEILMQDFIVS